MQLGLARRSEVNDEPLLRYVLDAKPLYEHLQRTLMQLSGLALMRLTSRRNAVVDLAADEAARDALTIADADLASLPVPQAAVHHRHHLEGAASALRRALDATFSRIGSGSDELYRALEDAERHLRATSKILPGFEMVDLMRSCCAAHGRRAAPAL